MIKMYRLLSIICLVLTGCSQNSNQSQSEQIKSEQIKSEQTQEVKTSILKANTNDPLKEPEKKKDKLNLKVKKSNNTEISEKLKEVEITKSTVTEKHSDLDYIPRKELNYDSES